MSVLDRIGGALVAPRATAAALPATAGAHDGALLVALVVFGGHLVPVAEALARALVAGNLGGVAAMLATLARVVLIPVVLLTLCEGLLGRGRDHRRGLALVPFVAVGLAAHALELTVGWRAPNSYAVPATGALLSAALARWMRPAVPVWAQDPPPPPMPVTIPAWRRRLSRGVGAAVFALAAFDASVDLARVGRDWGSYGPLAGGAPVPDFELPRVDGGTLRRSDLMGRVTVLSFWASWCGVCRTEMPMYAELSRSLPDGARVVLVNREGNVSPAQARAVAARVVRERGLSMPVAVDDGRLYRAVRGAVLPHTVVIDRQGRIRHVHEGRVMARTLSDEVARLLAE